MWVFGFHLKWLRTIQRVCNLKRYRSPTYLRATPVEGAAGPALESWKLIPEFDILLLDDLPSALLRQN